jgi:ABC-type transport system involved in multi-copper enzyme maturation permease subunit
MRRGRLIGLVALSSVPALTYWLAASSESDRADVLYPGIVAGVGYTFAIAVLIITVAILRDERDSGTLPYIYMRPISRSSMALSSIGAGIAAGLTLAVGGWLATVLATLAAGEPFSTAAAGIVQFSAAAVGYAAVFVPLGYLVPRSVLVGLGYIVIVESILGSVVTGFAQLSIWRIALSIYADVATNWDAQAAGDFLGPVTPGVGGGVVKIAALVVFGFAILTWALRRRDAL